MPIVRGVLVGAMLSVVVATGAEAHPAECGGLAPVVTFCTTGSHTNGGDIGHGVRPAGPEFTGTLVSWLLWDHGFRSIECRYFLGDSAGCMIFGEFPPAGTPFTQECQASEFDNIVDPPIGRWSCSVTHN